MIDRSLNYGRDAIRTFLEARRQVDAVLDLGAGRGDDLVAAGRAHPEAALHAVEVAPKLARDLRARAVTVHEVDLETDALPLGDESVDVIIANQVLEHVKEIFWIMHEVSRVLRVGGSFLVGVPNLAAGHNRVLLGVGRQPSCLRNFSAHVRGWTQRDFASLVETAWPGYRLVARRGANFYPFPPLLARPLARLLPGMAWGIFMDWRKERPYDGAFMEYLRSAGLETDFHAGPERSLSRARTPACVTANLPDA